jgi:hypothetical protein
VAFLEYQKELLRHLGGSYDGLTAARAGTDNINASWPARA